MEDQEQQTWSKGNYAKAFDSETKQQKIDSFAKSEHVDDGLGELRYARKQLDNLEPPTERKEKTVSAEDRISEEQAGFRVARQRLGEVRPKAVHVSGETTGTLGESAKIRTEKPKEGVWNRLKGIFRTSNTEQAIAEKSYADLVNEEQAGYKVAKERLGEPLMTDVDKDTKYSQKTDEEKEYELAKKRLSYEQPIKQSVNLGMEKTENIEPEGVDTSDNLGQHEGEEEKTEGLPVRELRDKVDGDKKEEPSSLSKPEERDAEPKGSGIAELLRSGRKLKEELPGGGSVVYSVDNKGRFTITTVKEVAPDSSSGYSRWNTKVDVVSEDELASRFFGGAQSRVA